MDKIRNLHLNFMCPSCEKSMLNIEKYTQHPSKICDEDMLIEGFMTCEICKQKVFISLFIANVQDIK